MASGSTTLYCATWSPYCSVLHILAFCVPPYGAAIQCLYNTSVIRCLTELMVGILSLTDSVAVYGHHILLDYIYVIISLLDFIII